MQEILQKQGMIGGKQMRFRCRKTPSELSIYVNSGRESAQLQSKSVSLTSTSAQTFTKDPNYDGMSSITVTPNLQTKNIYPSYSIQTLTPDNGYCGLKQVTVNAISSDLLNFVNQSVSASSTSGKYLYNERYSGNYYPYTYEYNLVMNPYISANSIKRVSTQISLSGSRYYGDYSSISYMVNDFYYRSFNVVSIFNNTTRRWVHAQVSTNQENYQTWTVTFIMDQTDYSFFSQWQSQNSSGDQLFLFITFYYN